MMKMNGKLVVGVAGMPGAGKSLVVEVATKNSYDIVVMGDIVREEAERQHLEPSPESIGKIMLELRQNEGKGAIAKRCIPKIAKTERRKVIVDGIRSLSEVEEFKNHFEDFVLLAVHASPERRFRRLYNRQRSDDPKSWEVFQARDMRELGVGLGEAIAMADYVVVSEERVEVVKRKVRETLGKVEEKWMK
jgi:dephospho-CoA kinase